ncbi:DUF5677 domain-containing protein [Blautia sp. MSJ-9]|uniref:DUF5677 domain-containing protein n=1 Tax=Blautia sp. MSJ-9 TaxID=2841511 RepID=UPI001C108870|nr:DUF5677 domain-containing protein [Blautia sp. MSJ-9]MBU5679597.1 hypothetical protein [Blautia sp. MSJ-9]
MNGSYAPELTDLLKEITEDIAKYVIKEGQPIILIDEYSWYREVLSLMAKQVNLCDSCILLLENGMEQEAYLLARSQFNNALWIKYLCEAEEGDNTRLKEFFYQPDINQLRSNQNLKKMIHDFGDTLDDRFKDPEIITKLNRSSREIREILKRENLAESPKSIAGLAKQDPILFGMYITLYNEGSKFEHSDISTTKLYRKQIVEGYPKDKIFIFDLGKSNKEGWFKVFQCSQMSLYFAFDSICKRVKDRESQLFETTSYGKGAYSKKDFNRILLKFNSCMSLYDKCENER